MAMGVAQQIWTESDNFDFLAGGGESGQWGKLFKNATFTGWTGRLTAPSNKICCGDTFQFSTDSNQIWCAYRAIE